MRRGRIPAGAWKRCTEGLEPFQGLNFIDTERLRDLASLFLLEKPVTGAAGLVVDEDMAVTIAACASLPILNLSLDWYEDWHQVILYPDSFITEHEEVDEAGVVHTPRRVLSGEAWEQGPLILSWADVMDRYPGANVVIHECAHKLDMRNGAANGMPPLHRDMSREAWTRTFMTAFDGLNQRLDHGLHTALDPYAAESPGEFFAVTSEAFFEAPESLWNEYPLVYSQLTQFYRQDPLRRSE